MKRLILAAGGLLLATANTPPSTADMAKPAGELDSVVAAQAPEGSEPVAAKPVKPSPPRIAVAPEAGDSYPRCSPSVRDRCAQGHSRHARASTAHRMQLAMRAGERG